VSIPEEFLAQWRSVDRVVDSVFRGDDRRGLKVCVVNGLVREVSYTKQVGSTSHSFTVDPTKYATSREMRRSLRTLKRYVDTGFSEVSRQRASWSRFWGFLALALPRTVREAVWQPAVADLILEREEAKKLRPGRVGRWWVHFIFTVRTVGIFVECSVRALGASHPWILKVLLEWWKT